MKLSKVREVRRARLLMAAEREFLKNGFEQTKVADIVRQAHGSMRSVYTDFGDKAGLFEAVIVKTSKSLAHRIDLIANSSDYPDKALLEFGLKLMESMTSDRALALHRMVTAETVRTPRLGTYITELHTSIASQLAAYLARQTAEGRLNLGDPLEAAILFMGMIEGDLHLRALLNPNRRPARGIVAKRVRSAVGFFLLACSRPSVPEAVARLHAE